MTVGYKNRVAFCPQCKKITNQSVVVIVEHEIEEKVIECSQCGQTLGYELRRVEE